jgi:uncharacterized membrane protein YuzA (DUF378 family)
MPHRLISYSFLDLLLGLLPTGLVGLFDFDQLIIAHMIGCYTGAYIKLLYDLKIKKMERQWAFMYALGSVSFGYVLANGFVDYYKIDAGLGFEILIYALMAIAANFVAVGVIKILAGLEQDSWKMTKDYFKKWLKNWVNSK